MKLIHTLCTILLIYIAFMTYKVINSYQDISPKPTAIRWVISISLTVFMIYYVTKRKFLGGIIEVILCSFICLVSTLSNYSFTSSLLMFFISGSKATKFKKEVKSRFDEDSEKDVERSWINVLSNGGVATILSLYYLITSGCQEMPINFDKYYNMSWFAISILGAFSCAAGDTLASELGTVLSSGDPYLITTFRRVPKGTNGGVSLYGLLVSALGGLLVGVAFYMPLVFYNDASSPPQFIPIHILGLFGGLFGSVIDSILGATLQFSGSDTKTKKIVETMGPNVHYINGHNILDNHCVNIVSILTTAMVIPYFAQYLWSFF